MKHNEGFILLHALTALSCIALSSAGVALFCTRTASLHSPKATTLFFPSQQIVSSYGQRYVFTEQTLRLHPH